MYLAKQCLDIILNVIRLLCPTKVISPPPSRPASIRRPRGLSTERFPDVVEQKQSEMHRSVSAPNFSTSDLCSDVLMTEQSISVALSETFDIISYQDVLAAELNSVATHCSVAICNLSRVVHFRSTLVENSTGIVSLLVMWLNACGDKLKNYRGGNVEGRIMLNVDLFLFFRCSERNIGGR